MQPGSLRASFGKNTAQNAVRWDQSLSVAAVPLLSPRFTSPLLHFHPLHSISLYSTSFHLSSFHNVYNRYLQSILVLLRFIVLIYQTKGYSKRNLSLGFITEKSVGLGFFKRRENSAMSTRKTEYFQEEGKDKR